MTHQEAVDTLATERYLLDDMSAEDRLAFEDHFFSCEVCADDLRSAGAMLQGAKSGFAGRSSSAPIVPMPVTTRASGNRGWYRSAALPWAAAASLACVAAYQSVWVVPSLRRDQLPVALVPVTLHPASRGAEAIVPLGPGTRLLSLAVQINDPPQGGEMTYDLSGSDGRHVASGRVAAPAPGTPLLLLMPTWTPVGSMHYILSVHDAGPSTRLLGEYRFALSAQ